MDKVLHAQMPFTTGGQTINDRLTAAYHSLAGSQLGKTVCKATTEEIMGPKKKHLDYLLHCTHEPNVSIPQLANLLVERAQNTNWCVVYKSLITIHNLMCYGNERFSQYLASSNANFNLGNFLDKASIHGYDMSTHVRRYAKYISEKVFTYRSMAFDFCKVKRGREDGLLRTMPTDKLLKTLPVLQGQIDALLEFQVQPQELTNGVINSCFILLFRDLIRLFACYNDGIINLLEKYFDMNKKQCRDALDLYKSFLGRMDKVAEFLKVAETAGIDRGEIPDLTKAPSSLMEALEQHLNALEGGKGNGGGSRVTSPATVSATRMAIETLTTFQEPGYVDPSTLDEATKRKLLEEEQERMNMLKEQRLREIEFCQNPDGQKKTNPFLPSPSAAMASNQKTSDDLLSLDFGSPVASAPQSTTNPFAVSSGNDGLFMGGSTASPFAANAWGAPAANPYASAAMPTANSNGHMYHQKHQTNGVAAGGFTNDDAFAKAFGENAKPQQSTSGFEEASGMFGAGLQPMPAPPSRGVSPTPDYAAGATFNPFLCAGVASSESSWQSPAQPTPSIADSGFDDSSEISQQQLQFQQQPQQQQLQHPQQLQSTVPPHFNPFAAFQQNADALSSAVAPTYVESTPSPTMPTSGFYDDKQRAPPVSGYAALYASQGGAVPSGMESVDMGRSQVTGQSASGRSSVTASPLHVQQQQMASSSPVPIPGGNTLNIYQHTPFSNLDASYTSSPQLPRQMAAAQLQQSAAPMAASYTAGAAFGSGGGQQNLSRPPSAPAAELQGLDPFGDMLTPMASTAQAQMTGQTTMPTKKTDTKLVKGDLDSSLASLAQNLTIVKSQDSLKNKPVQWGGQAKGQQQMINSAPSQSAPMGASMNWNAPQVAGPMYGAGYPQAVPGQWGVPPGGMMPGMMPMQSGFGQPRPMYAGMPGAMGAGGAPAGMFQQQQPARMSNPQDPFGAL